MDYCLAITDYSTLLIHCAWYDILVCVLEFSCNTIVVKWSLDPLMDLIDALRRAKLRRQRIQAIILL